MVTVAGAWPQILPRAFKAFYQSVFPEGTL